MDLSGLTKGLMVVIGIAVATGHLQDLKMWAAREAFAKPNAAKHARLKSPLRVDSVTNN